MTEKDDTTTNYFVDYDCSCVPPEECEISQTEVLVTIKGLEVKIVIY